MKSLSENFSSGRQKLGIANRNDMLKMKRKEICSREKKMKAIKQNVIDIMKAIMKVLKSSEGNMETNILLQLQPAHYYIIPGI